MQNIFDGLPEHFFNLLSSNSNKELYAGCLMEIYLLFDREISYRMERDAVKQTVVDYILEEHSLRAQEEFQSPGELANHVLSRMLRAGWLEEETDSTTYRKYIGMTEQGLALAEFMHQTIRPEKEEYAEAIYQIYNTLKHREQWMDNPYVQGVKSIHRNARHIANSLKKLSTFLRNIIERMVREQSLESLTDNLLQYCEGDFIKEYSRLMRQQNIHLYRTVIREELDDMEQDARLIQRMILGCMEEEELSKEQAREQVYQLLSAARRFLTQDYDQIMYDIKQKLNLYINLAIGRARFLMNHEDNTRGFVEQTLKYLIADVKQNGDGELPEQLQGCFRLCTHEYLDTNSIRFPHRSKEVTEQTRTTIEQMLPEDMERAKQLIAGEAYNPYSRDRMKDYIDDLLGEREEITSGDFPMDSRKDLLSLLSAVVYAKDNGYEVELSENYQEAGNMALHSFRLKRVRREEP